MYLDGEPVGQTPYNHSDTRIVGTCTAVQLKKESYDTFNTNLCRNEEADVGAIIGGLFLLFPFLWTMKYKPTHTYQLLPSSANLEDNKGEVQPDTVISASKAERLRELKKLLDEGILTQEEFEKENKKILEEK